MACEMDMLSVLKLSAPKGPIPAGMKVTALQGPDTLQSANPGPVLGVSHRAGSSATRISVSPVAPSLSQDAQLADAPGAVFPHPTHVNDGGQRL